MSLLTDIVAYYKLDGNSNDSVGSNNGTDTSVTYTAAKINSGGTFNGTSSAISLSPATSLTGDFSLSLWASRAANSAFRVMYTSGTNTNHWRIGIDNSNNIVFTEDNIADYTFGSANMTNTSQLYHLVFVKTGTGANNMQLFVDGASAGTASVGTTATPSGTAYIGTIAASNYWNNQIDEFGIWSRALTSGEVSQLYNGGAGLSHPFTVASGSRLMMMGVGT